MNKKKRPENLSHLAQPTLAVAIQRYRQAAAVHPNMVLVMGYCDFYVAFDDSAETLNKELGLTISPRNGEKSVAFPRHSLDEKIRALGARGYRVATTEAAA